MSYLKNSITRIKKVYKEIININTINNGNFTYIIKEINKLENELFYINKLKNIELFLYLKKIFKYIEKYPNNFFEFKYILIEIFTYLDDLYLSYSEKNKNKIEKNELKISLLLEKIKEKYFSLINSKDYYYIKIILDKNVKFYYLSRRLILEKLKEYGKAYNYIPDALDDEKYDFFILDFKTEKKINLFEILNEIKKYDDAILNYNIYEVLKKENIYNLKIYFDKEIPKIENKKIIDIIEYEKMLDIYINARNQLEIIKFIKSIKNENIDLILYKNINNRETRIFITNDLIKDNLTRIDNIILEVIKDKQINDIILLYKYDFLGMQYLEYLKKKFNIEYAILS